MVAKNTATVNFNECGRAVATEEPEIQGWRLAWEHVMQTFERPAAAYRNLDMEAKRQAMQAFRSGFEAVRAKRGDGENGNQVILSAAPVELLSDVQPGTIALAVFALQAICGYYRNQFDGAYHEAANTFTEQFVTLKTDEARRELCRTWTERYSRHVGSQESR